MKFLKTALIAAFAATVTAAGFAQSVAVSSIGQDSVGKQITVAGKTSSFRGSKQPKAPNSFFLNDGTGTIRVVAWPDVFDQIKIKDSLSVDGTEVEAKGKLAEFKGKLEIHVGNAADITLKGGAGAAAVITTNTATATTSTASGAK
jgi:DNA/RNA endonuclease YhcR with UshA esterase domain